MLKYFFPPVYIVSFPLLDYARRWMRPTSEKKLADFGMREHQNLTYSTLYFLTFCD